MKGKYLITSLVWLLAVSRVALAADECIKAADLVQKGLAMSDGSKEESNLYRQAINLCPGLVEAYYNLGLNLQKQNLLEEATKQFEKAVALNKTPLFMVAKANALYLQGKLAEAEAVYNEVLELDSKNDKALQGLALVAFARNALGDAESYLRQAIQISSDDGTIFYNLALILEKSERSDEAIVSLETAIDKKPKFVEAKVKLAELYLRAGRYLEALNLMEPIYQGKMPAAQKMLLGVIYQKVNKLEEARNIYNLLLQEDPQNVVARSNLAQVDIQEGKVEDAIANLEKYNNQANPNAEILAVLGYAYLMHKEQKRAKEALDQALAISAKHAMSLNNRGVWEELYGDSEKAKSYFTAALEADPQLVKARENLDRLTK